MKNFLHRPLRLAAMLLFVALLVPIGASAQKFDFAVRNVTVKEAMEALNQQARYSVVIQSEGIDMMRRVSVSVKNASIEEVLDRIFTGQNVAYAIDGHNVSVTKAVAPPPHRSVG